MLEDEFFTASNLEGRTGIPASTWRYWASMGTGPHSFKIGRRRVWRRTTLEAWLAEQEGKRQ